MMDGQKKPRAREKKVVNEAMNVEKHGEGLGTGPVGNMGSYQDRREQEASGKQQKETGSGVPFTGTSPFGGQQQSASRPQQSSPFTQSRPSQSNPFGQRPQQANPFAQQQRPQQRQPRQLRQRKQPRQRRKQPRRKPKLQRKPKPQRKPKLQRQTEN